MQPDDEVTKRYRAIAREEPGSATDAAILAASRRAVRPSAARRWGAPVSIAAVLVLTFGLTLEMRHEEPGIESSLPARPAAAPEPSSTPATHEPSNALPAPEPQPAGPAAKDSASAAVQGAAPRKERAVPQSKPAARADKVEKPAAPAAEEAKRVVPEQPPAELRAAPSAEREAPAAFPAAPAPPGAGPAPQRAQQMNAAPAPAYAPRAKAQADTMLRAAPPAEPDRAMQELERIAELRAARRDVEADKALEAFRRDHPDYPIPEAMWERVRPR